MPAKKTKKPAKRGRPRKPKTPTEAQQVLNGVLAQLVPGEKEGNLSIQVQALGDIKLTEAPSILRLAAKTAENQLGIE